MIKGSRHTQGAKDKVSRANKGNIPPNKGIPCSEEKKKRISQALHGRKLSEEVKLKISKSLMGHIGYTKGTHRTQEQKLAVSLKLKGKRISEEQKRYLSESRMGSNNPGWKGGISSEIDKKRSSQEYYTWRDSVFKRDAWNCQKCGKHGGELDAHHIKPCCLYPELIFDINNGITLCKKCHRAKGVHNYKRRINI